MRSTGFLKNNCPEWMRKPVKMVKRMSRRVMNDSFLIFDVKLMIENMIK